MMREIVRYHNHKVYDRAAGTYTTMRQLARHVAAGDEISAWDDDKAVDITSKVLAKVVYEAIKLGLPVDRRRLYRLLAPDKPWRGAVFAQDGARNVLKIERHADRKLYLVVLGEEESSKDEDSKDEDSKDEDSEDKVRRELISLDGLGMLVKNGFVLHVYEQSDEKKSDITDKVLAQILYNHVVMGTVFEPNKIVGLLREGRMAA